MKIPALHARADEIEPNIEHSPGHSDVEQPNVEQPNVDQPDSEQPDGEHVEAEHAD